MSEEPRRDEKEEKDEKERDDSWDEKWRRDPVVAVIWACVLIWAGLVALASNFGIWENLLGRGTEWWPIAFIGAGVIVLLGVNSVFWYLPPILAVGSAVAVITAFLVERRTQNETS